MAHDVLDGLTPKERSLLTRANGLLKSLFKMHGKRLLDDVHIVAQYLQSYYATKRDREHFSVMYLDSKYRLIEHCDHSIGALYSSVVYPSVIMRQALMLNACAVIVAHNHPSGDTEPSPEDINSTVALRKALQQMNIQLLDHFIVGETILSMRQEGIL